MTAEHTPDTKLLSDSFTNLACCGIKEIATLRMLTNDLKGTENVAKAFARLVYLEGLKSAFIIFSEVRGSTVKYGFNLKDFIEAKKLGTVHISETVLNPNSGNHITVFLWQLDYVALEEWCKEFDPALVKPVPKIYNAAADCICPACVRERARPAESTITPTPPTSFAPSTLTTIPF